MLSVFGEKTMMKIMHIVMVLSLCCLSGCYSTDDHSGGSIFVGQDNALYEHLNNTNIDPVIFLYPGNDTTGKRMDRVKSWYMNKFGKELPIDLGSNLSTSPLEKSEECHPVDIPLVSMPIIELIEYIARGTGTKAYFINGRLIIK